MRICTIIATNYLAHARVLAASVAEHQPDATMSVLVVDDPARWVGSTGPEPFEVLHLDELLGAAEAHTRALIYDVTELATSAKAALLLHLLDRDDGPVAYLDPDTELHADLEPVWAALIEHDLALTPHLTGGLPLDDDQPRELDILLSGSFNLGFVAVGPRARPVLRWWAQRLARHSFVDVGRGLFTDQRWMDLAPGLARVAVIHDRGLNLAYWNAHDRRVSTGPDGRPVVAGDLLRLTHWSGHDPRRPWELSRHAGDQPRVLLSERPDLAGLVASWSARLVGAAGAGPPSPGGWDTLPDGSRLDLPMRLAARVAVAAGEDPPDPWSDDGMEPFLRWLLEPDPRGPSVRLSRYLTGMLPARPDVAAHIRAAPAGLVPELLSWALGHGAGEGYHPRLLGPAVPAGGPTLPPAGIAAGSTPGATVVGFLDGEFGNATGARLLVEALERQGVPVTTRTLTAPGHPRGHPFAARTRVPRPDDVVLLCLNADNTLELGRRGELPPGYRVGVWAWELTDLPTGMVGALDHVDEVWAISDFVRQAVLPHTDKPVLTVGHPIVAPAPDPGSTPATFGLPDQPYALFVFDLHSVAERKNPWGLLEAWRTAFPTPGPRTLVIKSINGARHRRVRERLRHAVADRPDVVLLEDHLGEAQLAALVAGCRCYVSLHRSEGFGLTVAEAMSLGRPVICTDWSGTRDFVSADVALLVPAGLTEVPAGCWPYPVGALWADPDLTVAAGHLRWVFDHPEEADRLGAAGREHVLTGHGMEVRSTQVLERIEAIRAACAPQAPPTVASGPRRLRRRPPPPPEPTPSAGTTRVACDQGVIEVPTDDVVLPWLREYGCWEHEETELIGQLLSRGGGFVDLGAHVGLHSLAAARRVGPGGTVLSVEPSPRLVPLLRANLAGALDPAVAATPVVVAAAAWDRPGALHLVTLDPHNSGDLGVSEQAVPGAAPVPGVRLDDHPALAGITVGVVKSDLQGRDHRALRGLTEVLRRDRPHLVIELWPAGIRQLGDDPGDVLGWYLDEGYVGRALGDTAPALDRSSVSAVLEHAERSAGGFTTLVLSHKG